MSPLAFNPEDLYPLLEFESYTYGEAQAHSAEVDSYLGFNCKKIESEIRNLQNPADKSQQNWNHLSIQAFQTPYVEIRGILHKLNLKPQQMILDLGCAYGRMGLILDRHYPEVFFRGYELEAARVQEAKRIFLKQQVSSKIELHQADLQESRWQMPAADAYFIFDYGTEAAVRKTLLQLQQIAQKRNIRVIARGRLVRFLIHDAHPWLCQVQEPLHFPHFSIYSS